MPTLLMIVAIGAIMYFLIIRPQARERKEQEALVASLAKDLKVVTSSGVHGKVVEVNEDTVVLEVGNKMHVTFDKNAVARKAGTPAPDKK